MSGLSQTGHPINHMAGVCVNNNNAPRPTCIVRLNSTISIESLRLDDISQLVFKAEKPMAQRESSDECTLSCCHRIALDGDLIMAFRSDPPDVTNLLVSQHVFRQSSEVFATLLVNHIHKFPPPSDGQVRCVSFEDDNLACMEMIVNILHLRNHLVPSRVTFPMLYGLAVIIHKYDLARAIGPWWVKEWCHQYLEIIEREEFSRWLFIATVLRQRASFTHTTRHLILSSRIDSHNRRLVTEHGQSFTTDVYPSVIGTLSLPF